MTNFKNELGKQVLILDGAMGTMVQNLELSDAAFGGPELSTLFCTTAAVDLSAETRAQQPSNGMTFLSENAGTGQSEHQVIL